MKTYIIYLRPRSSLASSLASDTLFGAVCWGIQVLQLKPDVGHWLASQSAPPFVFSSAFPAWLAKNGTHLLLYPRPATFEVSPAGFDTLVQTYHQQENVPLKTARLAVLDQAKQLKNASLISQGIFEEVVRGVLSASDVLQSMLAPSPQFALHGKVLIKVSEQLMLQKSGVDPERGISSEWPVQHNQIDRLAGATGEGQLFYQNEINFAPHAILWALLRAESATVEELIKPALRYLADTGLGANRTVGKGHFEITVEPAPEIPTAKQANGVMMLSRYFPTQDEVSAVCQYPLAYRLTTLRAKREQKFPRLIEGMAARPIYKQPIRVFEPGSVFSLQHQPREVYGQVVQVVSAEDGGPVYQSGAALPVFLLVRENGV